MSEQRSSSFRGSTSAWERLERFETRRRLGHGPAWPGRPLPEPSLPPGTDLLPQIRHIVVLMMENHSYDNYVGMLAGRGEGFRLAGDGEPDARNPDAGGRQVRAHHLPVTTQLPGIPSQSWEATHRQWGDGRCDGFVTSVQAGAADGQLSAEHAAVGMGYWSESDLPFYYGLARTFPLADRWFSSCLGPTFPNRRFLIAGTAHGLIDDWPGNLLDYPPSGTVFDLLDRHGISWANYHPMGSGKPRLQHYARHRRRMARRHLLSMAGAIPAVARNVQKDLQFTADVFPLGIGRYMTHVHSIDRLFADADSGRLPAFSIVDPDFSVYSEENPQDISKGESFAAEVITRIMHGSGWPHTLLIWVYDEHGGYYDHVPPPAAPPPDDVGAGTLPTRAAWLRSLVRRLAGGPAAGGGSTGGTRSYDRYGFRVPAVIVSPFARPGHVCSEVFDHTSVLKLVEQKWNLPPLTARDAAATSPLCALDLAGPPAFLAPPALPEPALKWATW